MKLDRVDLLAVAALLLTFLMVAAAPFSPKAYGDLDFHKHGKRVAAAIKGAGPWSEVEVRKAPGPIAFYTVPYLAVPVGASDRTFWRAGVAWTALWMAVALVLLRRVAFVFGGDGAARAAIVLALLSPFSVYYSLGIAAEGPAYVSMALFLFGWVRAQEKPGRSWPALLMIGGLVALILCRPNAALIPLLAIALWPWLRRASRPAARLALTVSAASLAAFFAIGLLVSFLHGGPAQSRQTGYFWDIALQGRYQFRTEIADWRFWDSSTRQGSRDFADFIARERALRAPSPAPGGVNPRAVRTFVIDDTLAHPFLTLKMAAVRVIAMHVSLVNSKPPSAFGVGPVPGPLVFWVFHTFVNIIGLGVALLALAFLWKRRSSFITMWPLWAPWLALVVFHAFVYQEPRYLLPAKYCQFVMAGCVVAEWLASSRSRVVAPV